MEMDQTSVNGLSSKVLGVVAGHCALNYLDHLFKDTIIQVFYWSHVSMAGVESDSEGKVSYV